MARKVKSAFVMFGKFKGERARQDESFSQVIFHNFIDREDYVLGDSEVEINKIVGYEYDNQYKVVVAHADNNTGKAMVQVFRMYPGIGDKLVQQEEIRHGSGFQKIYLTGTDVVLRVGVSDFWQATSDNDNNNEIIKSNLKILEGITGLKISQNNKTAFVSAEENANITTSPASVVVSTPSAPETQLGEED